LHDESVVSEETLVEMLHERRQISNKLLSENNNQLSINGNQSKR
jgi:hypothetical protein